MNQFKQKLNNQLQNLYHKTTLLLETRKNFCWVVGFFIVVTSLYLRSFMYISNDPAFYYLTAERILNGKRYYYDFFEPNFPLNFYLYAIPVIFHKITGISSVMAINLFITIFALLSIYFSSLILKKTSVYKDAVFYQLLMIFIFIGHFLPLTTFSTNEIGTKTLFFLSFTLPYFCYFFCEIDNKKLNLSTNIIIGIFVGLSICLKPHYAIFPIVMELYLLIKKRTFFYIFRPLNLAILAVNILHIVFLFIFVPEYIFKIIPITMVAYYGIADNFFLAFFENIFHAHLFSLSVFLIAYFKLPKSDHNNLLFLAVIASTLIFASEGAVHLDQYSIMYFFSGLLLIKIILDLHRTRNQNLLKFYHKIFVFLPLPLIFVTFYTSITPNQYHLLALPKILEAKNKLAKNEQIYLFSNRPYIPISLYSNNKFYKETFSLIFIDGVIATQMRYQLDTNSDKYKMALNAQRYLVDIEIEQITKYKPQLLMFSNYSRVFSNVCPINYIEYFNQFEAFRKAFSDYQFYDKILLTDPKATGEDKYNIVEDMSVYIRKDSKNLTTKQITKFQGIFF